VLNEHFLPTISPCDVIGLCAQTGLTSLSIAERLGYISVVELLKNITDVAMSPLTMEEKYKVLAPEIMQEAALSDSDEEGGTGRILFISLHSHCSSLNDRKRVFYMHKLFRKSSIVTFKNLKTHVYRKASPSQSHLGIVCR